MHDVCEPSRAVLRELADSLPLTEKCKPSSVNR